MKTILALDIATTTGWAYRSRSGGITAGSWLLQAESERKRAAKQRLDRRLDGRIPALYRQLVGVWNDNMSKEAGFETPIDFIVFEDVQFSKYTLQTQLWSSLRAAVWLFAHRRSVEIDCIDVKTLKQLATGSGAADKDFMMRAAAKLFPSVTIVDDNCADALHLLQWAMTLTKRAR